MPLFRFLIPALVLVLLISFTMSDNVSADIQLPSMGEASSAIISVEQERALGQSWLRSFRAQTDIGTDYILQEYTEHILFGMLKNSDVQDKRLDLIIVDNRSLNAFAVPGGIIGVNTGLFLYADTEAQFASVLAHELSHLSQRHFARSVAEQQINGVASMAGLLAGIVLAATAGGDAGMAMISATQAARLEAELRYSRQNEAEADRVGMKVLTDSGYDPEAMGDMFESMLVATRYIGYQTPEYLRSHPLTENRVNDAHSRARQFPKRHYPASPEYQLMKTRIDVTESGSPDQALQKYQGLVDQDPSDTNLYGLALAYKNALKLPESLQQSESLYKKDPSNIQYGLLYADLLNLFGEPHRSEQIIRAYLQYRPDSHSLHMALANSLIHDSRFEEAATVLKNQIARRPNDSAVWYEYSETLGLTGEILELHKARAEYFVLVGAFDRAIRQLQFAKKEAEGNAIELVVLDEKISRAARLRNSSQF